MKKCFLCLITFLLLFSGNVYAQEIETFERTKENNYGIPERFKINETTIKHAKRIPFVDSDVKIYDFANLYSDSELENLLLKAQKISKREDYSVVVVTVASLDQNQTPRNYSDDFYDYNNFGLNGILFLIAIESRDVYISPSGYGQILFDDYRLDDMLDILTPSLSSGNYYQGTDVFLDEVDKYFRLGPDEELKRCEIVDDLGNYECKEPLPVLGICIGGISLSLLITILVVKSYKKIRLADNATKYIKTSDIDLSTSTDKLIFTNTSRTYVGSSSSSSGSSGSGSGRTGSSHRSSSRASHGGRGRKF